MLIGFPFRSCSCRPRPVPPADDLLAELARLLSDRTGLPADLMLRWLRGEHSFSPALEDVLRRGLDGLLTLLRESGLTTRPPVHHSTEVDTRLVDLSPKERGYVAMGASRRTKTAKHPFVVYLRANKLTAAKWCERDRTAPSTLSAWLSGRRAIPKSEAERIAQQSGGAVPVSAWPKLGA